MRDENGLDQWFVDKILVHEGALTRFLKRNWGEPADIPDLRQEVFARAFDAARKAVPLHPKSHLFTIARNLIVDHLRKKKVVPIDAVADIDSLPIASDEPDPERNFQGRQELRRLYAVLESLPPRCREVIRLRKIEQLSQREIAAKMGISENTVEHQVVKGMRLIADRLSGAEPGLVSPRTNADSQANGGL